MKKYLPILLFILAFSGYLFFQVALEKGEVEAGVAKSDNQAKLHYESLFNETKLATTTGNEVDLSSLSTPIVILNFWASWCTNCILEIPTMVEFYSQMDQRQITMIAINTDSEDIQKKVEKVSKQYNINFPIVADSDGSISQDFKVSGLPTTLVFKRGKLLEVHKGVTDFTSEEFKRSIR